MAVHTTRKPVEVFGPAQAPKRVDMTPQTAQPGSAVRLRTESIPSSSVAAHLDRLTFRWAIPTSDGLAHLEVRVSPGNQTCEASVTDHAGTVHDVDLPSSTATFSVVVDPEANLTHIDIPGVIAASVEIGPAGHMRILYVRSPLCRAECYPFGTGRTHDASPSQPTPPSCSR